MILSVKQRFPLLGTGHVVAEGAYGISPDLAFVLQEKSTDEQNKQCIKLLECSEAISWKF